MNDKNPFEEFLTPEETLKLAARLVPEKQLTMDQIAHLEKTPELWTDKKSPTPGYICHDYLRMYEREWSKWRDEPIRLLEIGLNKGASIKVWLEYFTKAQVWGVDIDLSIVANAGIIHGGTNGIGRFAALQGDSASEQFWENTAFANLNIVIDDGSHFSGPIHTAFKFLWPRVTPGGYYVIEDISEVLNPKSHTAGFPDQMEFVHNLINPVIFGANDIDEMMISKDLCMLRKKA